MLVELAAINAAIGTIKTTIAHGHDLSKAASSIAKFVTAEEDIRERANAKKNSMFSKLLGKDTAAFEEFMHLEEIEQKKAFERLIRNIMISILIIVIVGGLLVVAWFAYFLKGQQ